MYRPKIRTYQVIRVKTNQVVANFKSFGEPNFKQSTLTSLGIYESITDFRLREKP